MQALRWVKTTKFQFHALRGLSETRHWTQARTRGSGYHRDGSWAQRAGAAAGTGASNRAEGRRHLGLPECSEEALQPKAQKILPLMARSWPGASKRRPPSCLLCGPMFPGGLDQKEPRGWPGGLAAIAQNLLSSSFCLTPSHPRRACWHLSYLRKNSDEKTAASSPRPLALGGCSGLSGRQPHCTPVFALTLVS